MSKPRVEVLPIEEGATPDPNNINKHTQRGGGLLENSLRKRGAFRSIASAGKDAEKPVVYAGNYTLEKAIDAGFTEVVNVHVTGNQLVNVVRDDLAPGSAEAIALGLEDNEIGKQSYNPDLDILAAVMADPAMQTLKDEDRILAGLVEGMGLPKETKDAEPQIDRAAELLDKWQVKPGDLWQIGAHRLLCGDSTKREDVERVMGGERAELLFTSPPYSDMREYTGEGDLSLENLVKFIPAFYNYCNYQVINLGLQRKDKEIYPYWDEYIKSAKGCGYKFLSWNVWSRESAKTIAHQTAFIPIAHEWIFVFGNNDKDLNRTKPMKQSYLNDKRKSNNYINTQIVSITTIQAEMDRNEYKHPARFPVEFPTEYIEAMTNEGELVVEPFCGSGTTLVACQNLSRRGRAIEISPAYCAVTLERMATAFPGIEIKRL
jgi:DNA modification methylase